MKQATDTLFDCPSKEELQLFFNSPDYIHFAGMLQRPGVKDCFMTLEYTHYLPGTSANDKFQLMLYPWKAIMWTIASIPPKDYSLMEKAAAANGLKIVDGVPTIIDSEGIHYFPYKVFTLENVPGHPIYSKVC